MTWLPRLRSFLRASLRRSRLERDMDEELRFHLDVRVEELTGAGMARPDAEQLARREFGDPLRCKEAGREARGLRLIDEWRTDMRYALRCLRRSPGFCAAAMLSMALGIGANTAIFSLVNAVLLRPLPVRDPDALILLGVSTDTQGVGSSFPYPFYRELRDATDIADGVLASATAGPSVEVDGESERAFAELVSGNYFEVLGIRPHLGRLLTPQDDLTPGAHPVAVLSHRFWHRRFRGDPNVVGRTISVNLRPMTIVGVTPASFHGIEPGASPDIRVPIVMQAEMDASASRLASPREWWLQIVVRARRDRDRRTVEGALAARFAHFVSANGLEEPGLSLVAQDGRYGRPSLRRDFMRPLLVLSALVAVVLVLVCINVANLMLARAAARRGELAVRLALGAGRARLGRQLVLESVLLAAGGGVLGLIVALWGARALAILTAGPDAPFEVPLDLGVLAYASLLSIATGVLCGVAPSIVAAQTDLAAALKSQSRHPTGRRIAGRQMLVAAQIALSLTLLAGAGLFIRTLTNIRDGSPGFETGNLSRLTVNPSLSGYSQERRRLFYDEVIARVGALPAVRSASLAAMPQLGQSRWGSGLTLDTGVKDDKPGPLRNAVGPRFFATVGIPLVAGREFTAGDIAGAPKVAIVNDAFGRKYFGGGAALGRRIGPGGPQGTAAFTIVGVAADSKQADVHEEIEPVWYVPYAQLRSFSELTLHVRTHGHVPPALDSVKAAVRAIDPKVTIFGVTTMREQIEAQVTIERLLAVLATCFAVVATLLASLGLYGVMSYAASARTREIGVRIAVGATPRAILALMLRQAVLLIGVGVAVGLAGVLATVGSIRSLLVGIEPTDPSTIVTASAILVIVAALAAWLPARRATRIDVVASLQ